MPLRVNAQFSIVLWVSFSSKYQAIKPPQPKPGKAKEREKIIKGFSSLSIQLPLTVCKSLYPSFSLLYLSRSVSNYFDQPQFSFIFLAESILSFSLIDWTISLIAC